MCIVLYTIGIKPCLKYYGMILLAEFSEKFVLFSMTPVPEFRLGGCWVSRGGALLADSFGNGCGGRRRTDSMPDARRSRWNGRSRPQKKHPGHGSDAKEQ